MTIAAENGFKIATIKITYKNTNDGVAVVGGPQYASASTIEVAATSVAISVDRLTGATSTKGPSVQIQSIEVVYVAA